MQGSFYNLWNIGWNSLSHHEQKNRIVRPGLAVPMGPNRPKAERNLSADLAKAEHSVANRLHCPYRATSNGGEKLDSIHIPTQIRGIITI